MVSSPKSETRSLRQPSRVARARSSTRNRSSPWSSRAVAARVVAVRAISGSYVLLFGRDGPRAGLVQLFGGGDRCCRFDPPGSRAIGGRLVFRLARKLLPGHGPLAKGGSSVSVLLVARVGVPAWNLDPADSSRRTLRRDCGLSGRAGRHASRCDPNGDWRIRGNRLLGRLCHQRHLVPERSAGLEPPTTGG